MWTGGKAEHVTPDTETDGATDADAGFPARFRAREPLVGCWSLVGHPVVAEFLAQQGFDFVVADGEHTENDLETLASMVRAVEAAGTDTEALVRPASADPTAIKRVLDLGPRGIIVPQIEGVGTARDAVSAATYPPAGERGLAGTRPSEYGADLAAYVERASEDVLTILQVETVGAVEDVEEIAALDGVDGLLVGPADLSARLGVFGEFESDLFRDAVGRVVEAADAADTPVGTLATTRANLETRHGWGMDYMVAGTDLGYLRDAAADYQSVYAALQE